MSEYIITPDSVPSQVMSVTLGNQRCTLLLRELNGRQYLSLSTSEESIFHNQLLVDRVPCKKYDYLPFEGDIACMDKQGFDDPNYKEWGSRFVLVYSDTGFQS